MKTVFDVQDELNVLRSNGDYDSFGVAYKSTSSLNNRWHYVIMKNEEDFTNFKFSNREWDFKYNKLAV